MFRKLAQTALMAVVLCCLSGALLAQSSGFGAISGVVQDPTGAIVAGAKVVVENPSKAIRRDLVTTSAGTFAAPALVPAPGYTVTVSTPGFSTYKVDGIVVAVGETVTLSPVLQVSSSSTQVEVTAQAASVDATKTDVSQVVGTGQIQDLPINGRRVDSFVLLAPAVVPDGNFGLVSFRGIAGGNAFLTDGNDTTETYYNENAGRTRIQSQISQDAVQEFQVVSNNFSAEFGHAMGGVVNTVTRSGSNDFHGTGYWFFRNQNFNATDRFSSVDPATGKRFNPDERRNQVGVSAGGKIIKDKLFYFANYEGLRRDFPLVASITASGNPLYNAAGQWIATCGAPATAAQCTAIQQFTQRQFQIVPRTANQDLGFLKFDYRPNDANTITASVNLLRWVSPNGLQTQAVLNNGNGVGNNVNSSVRAKYGRMSWTNIPSPSMVNEVRFGWFNDKQFDYPNDALAIPGIGLLGISITGQSYLGTATDYPRKNPLENRYELADTLSWTKGAHTTKFGFAFKHTNDYVDYLANRTGSYSYPSISALAADFDYKNNTLGAKNWTSFSQAIGNPVVNFDMKDWALFVQDQWKVSPRLTLNLGVRYDKAVLPQPSIANSDYPATGRIPGFNGEFAPRVGLSYALDSQNKTVLRAGYGIFFGRYPGGLISTFLLGNGIYQKSITITDKTVGPVFPNILPSSASFNPPAGSVSLNMAIDGFRAPYTEQGDVAIERQITASSTLSASYIWSRALHLTSVNDINIGAPGPNVTYRVNDASGNQVMTYTTPVYVRQNRVDTRYNRINIVDAGLNSYYNALAVQYRKRMTKGLSGNVSYTWGHAIDYGQGVAGTSNIFASGGPQTLRPGDYRGEKGTASLDIRQRLVISGMWTPTFVKSNTGALAYLANGWGFSALGTFSTAPGATPNVSLSSAYVPTGYTVAQTGNTLNGYTSGGNGWRVPWLPTASIPIDEVQKIDLRIQKGVKFKERYQAMFTFDAFNIFNHTYFTSVNTRAYTYQAPSAANGNMPTLVPDTTLGVGSAAQGFPDGTNARRLQIGARFIW